MSMRCAVLSFIHTHKQHVSFLLQGDLSCRNSFALRAFQHGLTLLEFVFGLLYLGLEQSILGLNHFELLQPIPVDLLPSLGTMCVFFRFGAISHDIRLQFLHLSQRGPVLVIGARELLLLARL